MHTGLQKASLWKRCGAWLLDGILLSVLVVGVAFLLSSLLGYDTYNKTLEDAYAKYETAYGVTFDISEETYVLLSEQEKQNYDAAYQALTADEDAMHAYQMVINLMLVIVSVSLLLSILILEFVVPLLFGNGQTVGKKIFALGLMHTDGIRISRIQLFARALLGKYTIETMIPVYVLLMIFWGTMGVAGSVILLVLAAVQIILLIVTRTNSAIHDLLANTVVIDLSSQWIFDSREALLEYQKQQHAEQVARQPY